MAKVTSGCFALALLCGFGFVVVKVFEYSEKLRAGITLSTNGSEDGYPIESVQISQFDGAKWVPVGDVINSEGKTPLYEPPTKSQ